jgi:hypothetical protein
MRDTPNAFQTCLFDPSNFMARSQHPCCSDNRKRRESHHSRHEKQQQESKIAMNRRNKTASEPFVKQRAAAALLNRLVFRLGHPLHFDQARIRRPVACDGRPRRIVRMALVAPAATTRGQPGWSRPLLPFHSSSLLHMVEYDHDPGHCRSSSVTTLFEPAALFASQKRT